MRTAFFASVGAATILFMGCAFAGSAPETDLNSAGNLDGSFGSSGVVLQSTAAAGEYIYATGIAYLSNENIAISSTKLTGDTGAGTITIYSSNGSPTGTSYTYDSTILTGIASDGGMNFAASGYVGTSGTGTGRDFALKIRSYYFNSTTDPTTYVTTYDSGYNDFSAVEDMSGGGFDDEAKSIVYDSYRNRYLVGGYAQASAGGQSRMAIAAFNKDTGALDTSFGTGGKILYDLSPTNYDGINSLAVLYDGHIFAGGETNNGSSRDLAILKYDTNGNLDASFGTGGVVTLDYSGNDTSNEFLTNVLLQYSTQLVAVGTTRPSSGKSSVLLARYNSNGTLDTSFGINGVVKASFGDYNIWVSSAALQSNGKILVAGMFEKVAGTSMTAPGTWEMFVARFTANGLLDSSFGSGGFIATSVKGQKSAIPLAAAINASGGSNTVLVAGGAGSGESMNAAILSFVTQ